MHRQPKKRVHVRSVPGTRGGREAAAVAATYLKSAVEPWLVSGGSSFFVPDFQTIHFDVRAEGVQLVCYVYIPKGMVGFLKELRVAPFKPAVFSPTFIPISYKNDPDFLFNGNWIAFNPSAEESDEPTRPAGVWETPFAWENYFNAYDREIMPPSWRWYLKIIPGNIADLRAHKTGFPAPLPPIDSIPPGFYDSWYLVPDIAVPSEVYREGIPGHSPGAPFDGQRVQVIQGDKLSVHIPIPENSTLALFTRWKQKPVKGVVAGRDATADNRAEYTTGSYYPLLPSFGQLLGYNQSGHLLPAKKNSEYGWNG